MHSLEIHKLAKGGYVVQESGIKGGGGYFPLLCATTTIAEALEFIRQQFEKGESK